MRRGGAEGEEELELDGCGGGRAGVQVPSGWGWRKKPDVSVLDGQLLPLFRAVVSDVRALGEGLIRSSGQRTRWRWQRSLTHVQATRPHVWLDEWSAAPGFCTHLLHLLMLCARNATHVGTAADLGRPGQSALQKQSNVARKMGPLNAQPFFLTFLQVKFTFKLNLFKETRRKKIQPPLTQLGHSVYQR